MPFIPEFDEVLEDLLWWAISPVTAIPTLVYSSAGALTGDYPLGKPDWGANLRNAMIWSGSAGGVYAWNYFMSPHNAAWVSGTSAFKVVGHVAMGAAAPLAAVSILIATPIAMVANAGDPNQGRQLQSAGSGQPSIGSGGGWLLGY